MSAAGSVPTALANGSPYNNGRHQTPADMVGNQFVSQFYTVLHSSPRYLHRFYTDDSTVTHADCGLDGEQPTTMTVTTQKGISERVSAMGFEEAVTEIWSVDSQYSMNNGVVVMVTGSLQCKGKKKRDFVQSFFLAVQEKGYFVLNDTFRYLSDRAARPNQYPKENGYIPDYKGYNQMGGYPHSQHAYYPSQLAAPNAHVGAVYQAHAAPLAYPAPPATAAPQRAELHAGRGHAVTPSMPPREAATLPAPPKQTASPAPAPVQQQVQPAQQQQAPISAPVAPQQAAVVHTAPPTQPAASSTAAPITAPPPQQPSQDTPKQQPAPAPTVPSLPKVEATAAVEAPVQPPSQPNPISKPEPKESKAEASPQSEPPAEAAEPAVPAAPLTYAERLKRGSRAPPTSKQPAPAKPSSAPPKPIQAPSQPVQQPPQQPAKPAEEAGEENHSASGLPSSNQPPAELVSDVPEENILTTIFVRDLPEGATAEMIEAAFARFGPVKGGLQGVKLKIQRGKEDFAFVEFEEAAAMQASIEGQVIIEGKTVNVVPRRPMFPRNLRGPGYQRREGSGRGNEGRGYRGGPGRGDRGRGRGDGRAFPGRMDGRGEGRDGGRGKGFGGNFQNQGDNRGEGGRGGRGEGGRGRGPGAKNPRGQSAPPARPQA